MRRRAVMGLTCVLYPLEHQPEPETKTPCRLGQGADSHSQQRSRPYPRFRGLMIIRPISMRRGIGKDSNNKRGEVKRGEDGRSRMEDGGWRRGLVSIFHPPSSSYFCTTIFPFIRG